MENYIIGLDIGIASIGWAVLGMDKSKMPTHIAETGVVVVESMEDDKGGLKNVDRRDYRGARRTLRRRKFRVNSVESLIKERLNIKNIDDIYKDSTENVYELKCKGIYSGLNHNELSRVLLHYVKHRGFKSNRKNEEEEKNSEDGKVTKAIKENEQRMKDLGVEYISELLLKELDGINTIKNTDNYKFSFSRSNYEKEINALLDTQILNNVIDEEFKNKYIEIWSSQRDFSEGPGGDSKYAVNFANVFGYCKFTGDIRAPKTSVSQEINTLLSKLINLRYKHKDSSEFVSLSAKQINLMFASLITKTSIKYSHIIEMIYKNPEEITCDKIRESVTRLKKSSNNEIQFKGLRITKQKYAKIINSEKDISKEILDEKIRKETYSIELFKPKGTSELYNSFSKVNKTSVFEQMFENDLDYLDDLAICFTFYKTDEGIARYLEKNPKKPGDVVSSLDWSKYNEVITEVIPTVKTSNFVESASLSLELLKRLNNIMKHGIKYSDAMLELGFEHSVVQKHTEPKLKLPLMKKILQEQFDGEISNPRVVRVLCRLQSLINSIVDKYGSPYYINLEVARDINLKRGKRAILENEQLSNLAVNERIKSDIANRFGINYSNISKQDLEKYKLYEEQNGKCAYTLQPIGGNFLTSEYEIDHIIPFSVSGDNSFYNKTLVKKSANQEKTNQVPLQFFKNSSNYNEHHIEKFKEFVNSSFKMSVTKKENYLTANISDIEKKFTDRDLTETRFITKYIIMILENNLKFADSLDENKDINKKEVRIRSHKAGYVNILKKSCGLTNLTHSYVSKNYIDSTFWVIEDIIPEVNKDKSSITLKVVNADDDKKTLDEKIEIVKETENTPDSIKKDNLSINRVLDNLHLINFEDLIGTSISYDKGNIKNVFDIIMKIGNLNIYTIETDKLKLSEHWTRVLGLLKARIEAKTIKKKNRENHLHHALDAVATGVLTVSMQQKISKFFRKKEEIMMYLDKNLKEENFEGVRIIIGDEFKFDNKTGQLVLNRDTISKYVSQRYSNGNFTIKNIQEFNEEERLIVYGMFPEPFEGFRDETLVFVYEQNYDVQCKKINDDKVRNLRPLIPVIKKKKRYDIKNGKLKISELHKQTVMGASPDGKFTTKRISTKELTKKDIEKILGKDTYSKHVYKACIKWLDNKKPTQFPKLENGRDIKKIKITDTDMLKAINIGRGYVQASNVVRIDIFTHCDSDKLYFLQQTAMSITKDFNNEEFDQVLWYGTGTKKDVYKNTKIKQHFNKLCELHPGDLIEIEKHDGKKDLAYVIGFSGGRIEVADVIGDNYRVKKTLGMNGDRITISVSTIKSIQKKKINIRGEVKGYELQTSNS